VVLRVISLLGSNRVALEAKADIDQVAPIMRDDPRHHKRMEAQREMYAVAAIHRTPGCASLVQLIGHLVERGLNASLVLFAAWRARRAGCPDDLVTHLDRERSLVGDDVGQMDQA
jgi:hypothetical protein